MTNYAYGMDLLSGTVTATSIATAAAGLGSPGFALSNATLSPTSLATSAGSIGAAGLASPTTIFQPTAVPNFENDDGNRSSRLVSTLSAASKGRNHAKFEPNQTPGDPATDFSHMRIGKW